MFELYLTESCGRTLMEDDACPGWNLSLSARDNCVQCGYKEAVMAGPAVPTLTLTPPPTPTLTLTVRLTLSLTLTLTLPLTLTLTVGRAGGGAAGRRARRRAAVLRARHQPLLLA